MKIRYDDVDIEMSDKYSGKGFPYHDVSFKHETDMKDINIYGSCFYQECREGEEIVKDIFPDMAGVTFYNCNLDNIYVDEMKNTIIGGNHRKIKIQNDLEDWILNDDLTPKEPMDKKRRLLAGVSIDPKDLPPVKFTKEECEAFRNNLDEKYQKYKRNR